jgi:hypothetical protein
MKKEELQTLNNCNWYESIKVIMNNWNEEYGRLDIEGKDGTTILELITGGWSENEEIINQLSTTMFWILWWQESKRGGYYKFIYKD